MSRHWKPEIVRSDWTTADAYRPSRAPAITLVLLGAVALGLGGGFLLSRSDNGAAAKPDSPIEWNAVQAVPTRQLSPDEVEWARRGDAPMETPLVDATGGDASASPSVIANDSEAIPKPGLPRGSAARNDVYVIDGDTFVTGGMKVRIAGIDAPETHPPRCADEARLGALATQKLRALLASGPVTISGAGHDRYGRELRNLQVSGQDVGEAMISAGVARSYDGRKRQGWCG